MAPRPVLGLDAEGVERDVNARAKRKAMQKAKGERESRPTSEFKCTASARLQFLTHVNSEIG